jgi:hypothetical protein
VPFFEFISKICFVCWNYKSVIFWEDLFYGGTTEFTIFLVTSAGFNAIPDLGDLTGLYFPGLTFLYSIGYFLSANTAFC